MSCSGMGSRGGVMASGLETILWLTRSGGNVVFRGEFHSAEMETRVGVSDWSEFDVHRHGGTLHQTDIHIHQKDERKKYPRFWREGFGRFGKTILRENIQEQQAECSGHA